MAEDKGGSPLPQRVPGTKRGPGTGPLTRPELSDSDLQRIRAALDSAQAQASAPPAERPASLPRRVPDVGNESGPPARKARPELPAALLPTRRKKTRTEPAPAVPAPRPSQVTQEAERQPEVTAEPGPAAADGSWPSAGPRSAGPSGGAGRAARSPGRGEGQPGAGDGEPEARPAGTEEGAGPPRATAGLGKAQLHGTRALPRRPKLAPPETPPPPPKPAPPRSAPPPVPASPPPAHRGSGAAAVPSSPAARSPPWSSSRRDQPFS